MEPNVHGRKPYNCGCCLPSAVSQCARPLANPCFPTECPGSCFSELYMSAMLLFEQHCLQSYSSGVSWEDYVGFNRSIQLGLFTSQKIGLPLGNIFLYYACLCVVYTCHSVHTEVRRRLSIQLRGPNNQALWPHLYPLS